MNRREVRAIAEDEDKEVCRELRREMKAMRFLPSAELYVIGSCGYCGGPVLAGTKPNPECLAERYAIVGHSLLVGKPKCARCGAEPARLAMQERRTKS